MGEDRNHFKFLNKITEKVSSFFERIRIASPAFYLALQIIFFLLLAIATYLIEQACDKGWTVILLLALFGILLFLAVFAFDYANAKRINHQFFWKPWILILILILNIMFLGLRIGGQRTENARILQETNDFYGDLTRSLTNTIEATNSYYAGKIAKLNDSISSLNGQIADAKQDRDKYQIMLAPFEAMAIAKYTNAPLDERLDLLSSAMFSLTNALNSAINNIQSEKPKLLISVNGIGLTNVDTTPGAVIQGTPILIKKADWITVSVANFSKVSASHVLIELYADIDQTNLASEGWQPQPQDNLGRNQWSVTSNNPLGQHTVFDAPPLKISQNFKPTYLTFFVFATADNSDTSESCVNFGLQ